MKSFGTTEKNKGLYLALGFFDGVHLGHRKILSTLIKDAKANNGKTAVVTFSENPANYFSDKETLNIQSPKDRELVLETLGIDYLYELDFSLYKDLTAKEYIKNVLVKNFEPKEIIVGYNHNLGCDLKGASFVEECAKEFNYVCKIIPEQLYQNKEEISSTIIRKHIQAGHLNAANTLLNRNFSIRNSVVAGKQLARNLGYPTANIVWPDSIVKLPYGVYFGYVQTNEKTTPGLIAWGINPTLTHGEEEKLEVHLYDFDKNLYGKIIRITFVKKLRDEQKFTNIKELKEQLDLDYDAFLPWAKSRSF